MKPDTFNHLNALVDELDLYELVDNWTDNWMSVYSIEKDRLSFEAVDDLRNCLLMRLYLGQLGWSRDDDGNRPHAQKVWGEAIVGKLYGMLPELGHDSPVFAMDWALGRPWERGFADGLYMFIAAQIPKNWGSDSLEWKEVEAAVDLVINSVAVDFVQRNLRDLPWTDVEGTIHAHLDLSAISYGDLFNSIDGEEEAI
jgi:hypothetical protein